MSRGALRERTGQVWELACFNDVEIHVVVGRPRTEYQGVDNEYHPTLNLETGDSDGLYERSHDVDWELDHNMRRIA